MTEQTPELTKKILTAPIPRPTRDNPELIPESADGVRYMTPIPRRSGDTTPMYEHARYYDDDGVEQVVMSGTVLEEIDGEVGYPTKTYSREALKMIRAANSARMEAALARRAASQSGIVSAETSAPTDKEIIDENYKALMELVSHAVENSGHIDPCMNAGKISYAIEQLAKLPRVSDETLITLQEAKKICNEVYSSGRDSSSRYHRNQRAGLKLVETLLGSISN